MEGATSNPWLIAIINMTIVFGVLILILIFKPNGLFGKSQKEKV